MQTIYLVSCVSKKKRGEHPAKDIYDAPWFKKARACVELHLQQTDKWFILSAKYGLLDPDRYINSYDMTLKNMPRHAREEWAAGVLQALQPIIRKQGRVVILAGECYREFLLEGITKMCAQVLVPMQGMAIGKQLRWLGECPRV